MRQRVIESAQAGAAVGGYAQALELSDFNRLVFISGQVPVAIDQSVPTSFKTQCDLVWQHIAAQLTAADMVISHLVKVTTYLSDRKYRRENSAQRRRFLASHRPALTVIIADIYDPAWLLEIEAIAAA